ncbi:hypothetical protein BDV96DRAFT_635312 [Lophiotrema nucula]|uniref:Uncharacterized protein n=1 Tax=Lophiotrema nucula TaxID=690887 RepID=A0A6A5YU90_9PLEO|nr:hypothetical protein BDV96DRAFT_635312 [Lophiotrema nucula]
MVQSTSYFLTRDPTWDKEKPYTLRFQPVEGLEIPRTNVLRETHDVEIHDLRSETDKFDIETQGFTVIEATSRLAYKDYFDELSIKRLFYPEIETAVKKLLGATWVRVFEHTVRKRHPEFPVSTGSDYEYNQPAMMAHIDSTTDFALEQARRMTGAENDLKPGRYMLIHAWKPLKGPLYDWLLALCDARTVDKEKDIVRGDIVFPTYIIENYQVHHNEGQK